MSSGPDPKRRPGRPAGPGVPRRRGEADQRRGSGRLGGSAPVSGGRPPGQGPTRSGLRLGGGFPTREPRGAGPSSPRPGRPGALLPRGRLGELVGPDEEVVAGRWPVREAFVAGREARRLLVVPHRRKALEDLVLHAVRLRIPIVEVEGGILTAVAGFDGHQGIALVVAPRRPAGLEEILARALARGEPAFVLVLDSLEDPQNVGTLLRSAEAAGVHGVVVPRRRQAPLSPAAVKASAGATEHLLIGAVEDLPGALADLHVRGVRIVGADAEAPLSYRDADLRGPLAIVVGSEGRGLAGPVRRRCDLLVRIPLHGAVGSLNAAVAGSILLFEARAQRDADAGGRGAAPDGAAARASAADPIAPESDGPPVAGAAAPIARPRRRLPRSGAAGVDGTPEPEGPKVAAEDDLLPGEPVSPSPPMPGSGSLPDEPRRPSA